MLTLTDEQILQRTIDYCRDTLHIKELTIGRIGKVPKHATSIYKIFTEEDMPKVMDYRTLQMFGPQACQGASFDVVNYFLHYSIIKVLHDLRAIEKPEFTLEWLVSDAGYIRQRQGQVYMISYEEELKDSLRCLEEKYGKSKVSTLKRRLDIGPIAEFLLSDHENKYRKKH